MCLHVWAPPLAEAQRYSTSSLVTHLKYAPIPIGSPECMQISIAGPIQHCTKPVICRPVPACGVSPPNQCLHFWDVIIFNFYPGLPHVKMQWRPLRSRSCAPCVTQKYKTLSERLYMYMGTWLCYDVQLVSQARPNHPPSTNHFQYVVAMHTCE